MMWRCNILLAAFLACIWPTTLEAQPAQWNYGVNPATGNSQAVYPGDVKMTEMGGAGGCLQVDANGNVSSVGGGVCANASAGGTNGQVQYNNSGAFGGFTLSGDCTLAVPNITCTKTNGTAFGTAAAQNTGTSGANIPLLTGTNTWNGLQTYNAGARTATHYQLTGTGPTITSGCGTGGTLSTGSTDQAGQVNVGSGGTLQPCVLTFHTAFINPPFCVAQNIATGAVAITTTTTTVSFSALNLSEQFDYLCGGA